MGLPPWTKHGRVGTSVHAERGPCVSPWRCTDWESHPQAIFGYPDPVPTGARRYSGRSMSKELTDVGGPWRLPSDLGDEIRDFTDAGGRHVSLPSAYGSRSGLGRRHNRLVRTFGAVAALPPGRPRRPEPSRS